MWNRKRSVTLSIVLCFIAAALMVFFAIAGRYILEFYFVSYRGFVSGGEHLKSIVSSILWCYYPCAAIGMATLYSLLLMLKNIKKGDVFVAQNVRCLRIISWSCIAIFAITLVGAVFYFPLGFVSVAAGFVGMMLRVVKNVMQAAVVMREEQDLTI